MILEELSIYDAKWREIAMRICNDYDLAQDLVQLMYLKLMNRTKFNDYFITITLRNLFIDLKRKQKDIRLEELHYVIDHTTNFEPDDKQQKLLEEFERLDWVSKELLLEKSTGKSYRQIQKEFNINYGFSFRQVKKAKEQILKNVKK